MSEIPTKPGQGTQPKIALTQSPEFTEHYANSVQVKMSVWDFQLIFGTMQQDSPEEVTITNRAAVYLSPQQAKALFNVLGQNLAQYEQAFGTLQLEPLPPSGPVN